VRGRWRRASAVLGALVALMLAAGLVLLAADVRAWRDAVRDDDVLFQMAPARADWSARERAPFGLARGALGVDDDIELRRAVRLFQLARLRPITFEGGQNLEVVKVRAQIALTQLERNGRSGRDRAVAANLLGLLDFEQARNDPLNVARLLKRSADAFRRAVALDPAGEDAKVNLEILLRLTQPGAEKSREQVGIFGGGRGLGAGASRAGRGY
jgi:hypothetical protein